MKTTQTFSILIWANKARRSPKGLSLYARITINGQRAEISLQRKVKPEQWDAVAGKMKGTNRESQVLNNYILQVKSELYHLYNQMASIEEFISADSIKLRYTGQEEPRKSLLQVINIHNEEMERKIGTDVTKATVTKFKTLNGKTTAFVKTHLKKSDLYLE